jgi:hypothetical protein
VVHLPTWPSDYVFYCECISSVLHVWTTFMLHFRNITCAYNKYRTMTVKGTKPFHLACVKKNIVIVWNTCAMPLCLLAHLLSFFNSRPYTVYNIYAYAWVLVNIERGALITRRRFWLMPRHHSFRLTWVLAENWIEPKSIMAVIFNRTRTSEFSIVVHFNHLKRVLPANFAPAEQ